MNQCLAALLLAVVGVLAACHDSPSVHDQPITGNHPAPVAAGATRDTVATKPGGPVPFVNPTKVGRVLGSQSPSPPASRTQ